MGQRSDLDLVVDAILDAYGEDEQYAAFLPVLEEEAQLPAAATLLGTPGRSQASATPIPPGAWWRTARGRRRSRRLTSLNSCSRRTP
jgi:hypothetical protein